MTDKKSRRVVIINNINSDNIDQAIFILKSDSKSRNATVSSGIVKEAQGIIDNYIKQVERLKDGYPAASARTRRKIRLPHILYALFGILAVVCAGLSFAIFHISG